MKKITLILILIASFATKSFAHCPIPQWCPSAPLDQNINLGGSINPIEFPSVIGRTLVVEWWTDLTRTTPLTTPPPGVTVSGTTTNNREYSTHPIAISGTPSNAGTYHYTVSNLCGYIALSGTIRVGTPTSIITQPTGATVCQNSTLNLSVVASGTGLTYIWEQSPTSNPADFEPAPGTNNGASYTVNTATAGTFYYRVTVMGFTVVESSIVAVTVNPPPTIGNVTPAVERYTTIGTAFAPLTLTANPTGVPPITIQWFSNTTATNSGGISMGTANGAQTNTFTPPSDTVNVNGVYYYAVATSCGSTATTNISGKHIVGPTCTPSTVATGCATSGADVRVTSAGTVTYGASGGAITANTTTISGNGITQEWSDNVRASNCASRSTWNGVSNAMSDCRNATNGFSGHYFTWCFVNRYAATLCPSGFRVPTCQDFINLDIALGGNGVNRWDDGTGQSRPPAPGGETADQQVAWYIGTSGDGNAAVNNGGIWGGSRFTGFAGGGQSTATTIYWSSSQSSTTDAFRLIVGSTGEIRPWHGTIKLNGFALRCVR